MQAPQTPASRQTNSGGRSMASNRCSLIDPDPTGKIDHKVL